MWDEGSSWLCTPIARSRWRCCWRNACICTPTLFRITYIDAVTRRKSKGNLHIGKDLTITSAMGVYTTSIDSKNVMHPRFMAYLDLFEGKLRVPSKFSVWNISGYRTFTTRWVCANCSKTAKRLTYQGSTNCVFYHDTVLAVCSERVYHGKSHPTNKLIWDEASVISHNWRALRPCREIAAGCWSQQLKLVQSKTSKTIFEVWLCLQFLKGLSIQSRPP